MAICTNSDLNSDRKKSSTTRDFTLSMNVAYEEVNCKPLKRAQGSMTN